MRRLVGSIIACSVVVSCYTAGGSDGSNGTAGAGAMTSGGRSSGGAAGAGARGGTATAGASSGGTSSGGSSAGGSSAGADSSAGVGASAGAGGDTSVPLLLGGACSDTPEEPLQPACSEGVPEQYYCEAAATSHPIMAACPSFAQSQCEAGSACAPGWHLCTGSEYLARGGRDVPPSSAIIYGWIAACVRDETGKLYHDGVCSVCGVESGFPPAKIYDCSGTDLGPGVIDDSIGAVIDHECHRIGVNQADKGGYWAIYWAGYSAGYSICCSDP
ncbi:MAG TPA: hypothetical protein VGP93_18350 [Polyangiaceae bacterium]|jgi:hypothetical protein|nr:hypothetical protein [Polyangiaceae bacterium]